MDRLFLQQLCGKPENTEPLIIIIKKNTLTGAIINNHITAQLSTYKGFFLSTALQTNKCTTMTELIISYENHSNFLYK